MLLLSFALLIVIIFIILIAVFRRVLNQNVIMATKHLEELNEDYDKKEKEIDKRLEEAKRAAEELVVRAQEEVEKEKLRIIKEAETERDKILKEARAGGEEMMQQADKSRQLLLSELDERIAKEAVNKACELIQHTLPEQLKQDIHSQWIKELTEASLNQISLLHLPEDLHEINVTSAFSLREEERKGLSKKLKELLGRSVTLKEDIDPGIVAGVVVTIGSVVLDGSLKNKIKEQAESIEDGNG